MNILFRQRDSKQCRFQMPNDVWKWELKPQGFAILAYLCYLHTHHRNFAVPGADQIAAQLHMSVDMAMEQLDQLNHRGLINENGVPMFENAGKNFFSLPNELFFLNTGHGAITVYAYLLYCEDRRTQSMPSQLPHHLGSCASYGGYRDEAHRKAGGQTVHHGGEHDLHRQTGDETKWQQPVHHPANPSGHGPLLSAADASIGRTDAHAATEQESPS